MTSESEFRELLGNAARFMQAEDDLLRGSLDPLEALRTTRWLIQLRNELHCSAQSGFIGPGTEAAAGIYLRLKHASLLTDILRSERVTKSQIKALRSLIGQCLLLCKAFAAAQ